MPSPDPITTALDTDAAVLDERWARLQAWVARRFAQEPSIEVILFLMGIQSRGRGYEPELEKEVKQALIMEGTYCAFAELGIYEATGMEADGSWVWERQRDLPQDLPVEQQEKLLKIAILRYFDDILNTHASD